MRTRGGEPEDHVAGHDGRAVDDARLLDRAHRETGEVVLALRIHARHLRRLASDERAAGLLATPGDALDDLRGGADVELAAGEIVEEEKRLRALDENVVDAHRHEVDAHRVVAAELECQLELGAHPVGARHQHRIAKALADLEQRPEAADAGEHLRAHGALGEGLDALDQRVARVDVDAGIAVRV